MTIKAHPSTTQPPSQLRDLFFPLGLIVSAAIATVARVIPDEVLEMVNETEYDTEVEAATSEAALGILRLIATHPDSVALQAELRSYGFGVEGQAEPTVEELMALTGYTALRKRPFTAPEMNEGG